MSAHPRAHPAVLLAVATLAAGLTAAASRAGSAAGSPQAVPHEPRRAAHMQVHYAEVMTVHEAVIRGDLAATRAPADWLAEHDPPALPAGSAPFVAEMRRAARRTAQATTVDEAALGTA